MTMTAREAKALIDLMALWDNRKTDEADIIGWLKAIGDLRYEDCEQAVIAHYRESTDRIMPAHIRRIVRAIREDRLARIPVPEPPPELAGDPAAYLAALRAGTAAVADGRDPQAAMRQVISTIADKEIRNMLGGGDGK